MTSVVPMAAVDKGHFQRSPEIQGAINRYDEKHGAGAYDKLRAKSLEEKASRRVTEPAAKKLLETVIQGDSYRRRPSDKNTYHSTQSLKDAKRQLGEISWTTGEYRPKALDQVNNTIDYLTKRAGKSGRISTKELSSLL